jgi:hypothetical protein
MNSQAGFGTGTGETECSGDGYLLLETITYRNNKPETGPSTLGQRRANIEDTTRDRGIDIEDALTLAERTEI